MAGRQASQAAQAAAATAAAATAAAATAAAASAAAAVTASHGRQVKFQRAAKAAWMQPCHRQMKRRPLLLLGGTLRQAHRCATSSRPTGQPCPCSAACRRALRRLSVRTRGATERWRWQASPCSPSACAPARLCHLALWTPLLVSEALPGSRSCLLKQRLDGLIAAQRVNLSACHQERSTAVG